MFKEVVSESIYHIVTKHLLLQCRREHYRPTLYISKSHKIHYISHLVVLQRITFGTTWLEVAVRLLQVNIGHKQ